MSDVEAAARKLFDAYADGKLSLQHFVNVGAALDGADHPVVSKLQRECDEARERMRRRRAAERG